MSSSGFSGNSTINNDDNNGDLDGDGDGVLRFCSAPAAPGADSYVSLDFEPPPYRVNAATDHMHSYSPRFGHTKDINLLIQGSNEEQKDYLTGLLAGSFAVFCLFLVWMLVLWNFKCLGPSSRVGVFSARRILPTKPAKPDAVVRQERIRKKHPFQHNGVASGYHGNTTSHEASSSSMSTGGKTTRKKILKPVVGVAKAPITAVSKARQRKRELERRSQFSRMNSGSVDDGDGDEDNHNNNNNNVDVEHEVPDEAVGVNDGSPALDVSEEQAPTATTTTDREVITDADRKIIRQYEQDWKAYEQQIHRGQDRIRRIRIGAGFCAISILISALLFTIMTQDSFTTSLDMFDSGLQQVNTIIDEALLTSANFVERLAIAQDSTRKVLIQINDICPDSLEQLCTNINDETATTLDERGCDFSTLPFGDELFDMVNVFDTTLTTVLDNVGGEFLEQDLVNLEDLLNQADLYYPKHGRWAFWTAVGTSLALGVVALMLTGGMVYIELGQGQQPNGRERKLPPALASCRSWFLIPLLLLLVCLSWLFSMSFILMGVGSSDLCYNSPDVPILNLLETIEWQFDSFMYFFLRYYVSGCPAASAPRELELAVQAIQEMVLPVMGTLIDALQAEGQQSIIQESCGAEVAPFVAIIEALGIQLCGLSLSMADLRSLLNCENWYPLYRYTMHDAVCTHATEGFTWAASTQLVIVILSLVLLTLRASFFELDDEPSGPEEGKTAGCCPLLCPAKAPPKDEHIGEITVSQPKDPSNSNAGSSWCGCFGPKKPPPPKKDPHIGEIKVNKQAAAAATGTSSSATAAPPLGTGATPSKQRGDVENEEDEESSSSYESGSIEEESLKG